MSPGEVLWLAVAAVLALTSTYSFLLGVAYLFVNDGRKRAVQYLGVSVVAFSLWNGWNWLMGH
jgi:hypothetical protein